MENISWLDLTTNQDLPYQSGAQQPLRTNNDAGASGLKSVQHEVPDDMTTFLNEHVLNGPKDQHGAPSLSAEHRQEVNRQAQRRFRARQKSRAQQVEAELARAKAELKEIKQQQQQQEDRLLLQERARTQVGSAADMSARILQDGPFSSSQHTSTPQLEQRVYVSLPGRNYSLTAHDFQTMSPATFSALWTDYIRELGRLLLCMGDSEDTDTKARLEQLTMESCEITGGLKAFNPSLIKAITNGELAISKNTLGSAASVFDFTQKHVWSFSQNQYSDILYLRRLYLTRRAFLAAEREQITARLLGGSNASLSHIDQMSSGLDASEALRQNAQDDYSCFVKVSCALKRGVFTTMQLASTLVHAYPRFPLMEDMFESVAASMNAPTTREITTAAQQDPMLAEWAVLDGYVASLTAVPMHDYLPVTRVRPRNDQQHGQDRQKPIRLLDVLL